MTRARRVRCALLLALTCAPRIGSADQPGATTGYDTPPEVTKQVPPSYPREAVRDCIEGAVGVAITVARNGRVAAAEVFESVPGLDDAALDCVKKWRFEPARKDGAAVEARIAARIRFEADDCRCWSRLDDEALAAAESWLALIDAGDHRAAWEQASDVLRSGMDVEAWIQARVSQRGDRSVTLRVPKSLSRIDAPPGFPSGRYTRAQFKTALSDESGAAETVIVARIPGGQWRVVAYSTEALDSAPTASAPVVVGAGAIVMGPRAITEPRKICHVNPEYPRQALKLRIQGVVELECRIDELGRVQDIEVLQGPEPLVEAAVEAVRRWRYTTTLLDGEPVPVLMTVTTNFRMN